MARISILSNLALQSANVYPAALDISATNDRWKHKVYTFANSGSVRISVHGSFSLPMNYSTNAALKVVWTSPATSGNIVWDFDYRAITGDNAESLDQTSQQESVSVTDSAPTAAFSRLEASVNLTSGNFAAGDTVQFEFARDKSDAADNLANVGLLFDLLLDYTAA